MVVEQQMAVIEAAHVVDEQHFPPVVGAQRLAQQVGEETEVLIVVDATTVLGGCARVGQPALEWHGSLTVGLHAVGEKDVGNEVLALCQLFVELA